MSVPAPPMSRRPLGRTGLTVTPLGFGAFKIGRNTGTKYAASYPLPDEAQAAAILHGVLDLGIALIDTAPAYGVSEARVGRALGPRRNEFVLCTKAGESFEDGRSHYDFSRAAIEASLARSVERLGGPPDVLLIHSDGRDLEVLRSDAVDAVLAARAAGMVRAVGFSGKTVEGARAALDWADVLMVTYHVDDRSHLAVMDEAAERGVGVLVKKGLASGSLPPATAIPFVLAHPAVDALVIGGLDLDHLASNAAIASAARSAAPPAPAE